MHLSIPPSFRSRLDFIEFEKESVAAILGNKVGNGQGAPAQQIDIREVRVTRRNMKLQGVSREQFRIHAIGDGVSFSSATQCFHRLSADERERGTSVHEEKNIDERQRLLGTGRIVASTRPSARKVQQESLVVANNATVNFSLLVAHKLLVLLQVRKILYFKKGGEVMSQICCSDIGQENVELAGRKVIDIVHNYRFCARLRVWGVTLRSRSRVLEETINGCGGIGAFPFFLLERNWSVGMIHLVLEQEVVWRLHRRNRKWLHGAYLDAVHD